jgi:hypothetical protein
MVLPKDVLARLGVTEGEDFAGATDAGTAISSLLSSRPILRSA